MIEEEEPTKPTIGDVVWSPCDVGGVSVECATVDVPLDWDDPESRRIDIFLRRLPSAQSPSRGQFWYLVGGPGLNNGGNVHRGELFAQHEYDVYLLDYRGVGLSTSLECDGDGETITHACLRQLWDEWGEDLQHFSTTGAARDLGALIEATRKPSEEVVVMGASYGTYLANRYLHFFPEQASKIIQVAIAPTAGFLHSLYQNINRGLEELHRLCSEDRFCSEKLGPDPWARTMEILQRLKEGHCPAFTRSMGPDGLNFIVPSAFLASRDLYPAALATVHRIDRCEPEDVQAVTHFFHVLNGGQWRALEAHDQPSESVYLRYHITFSELWTASFDLDAYEAELRELPFGFEDNRIEARRSWLWPLYDTSKALQTWAPTSVPMLLLNGTLDVQTPIWELDGLAQAYGGDDQHFIAVPTAGHNPIDACVKGIMNSFLEDPSGDLPTGCVEDLRTIDWAGSRQSAHRLMGTDDLWSN